MTELKEIDVEAMTIEHLRHCLGHLSVYGINVYRLTEEELREHARDMMKPCPIINDIFKAQGD